MAAPKDDKPDNRSEHLETLARMLREVEKQLSEDDAETPPETAQISN
jgi:hypothetical protein